MKTFFSPEVKFFLLFKEEPAMHADKIRFWFAGQAHTLKS
jgi:hypothetical protein